MKELKETRVKINVTAKFLAVLLSFAFATVLLPVFLQAVQTNNANAKTFKPNFDPKNAGKTRLKIHQAWVLQPQKQLSEAFFTTYGFPNTSFQTVYVTASDPFTTEKDEFGNTRLRFKWTPSLGQNKTISLDVEAIIDYSKASEPASNTNAFLKESKLVILNPAIRKQASELSSQARDSQDNAEKTIITTEWVKNELVYDEPYWNSSYWKKDTNTTTIFNERKGVCKEFAHLLQALLRAQGIPARFVAGIVFSGEQWGAHAWVEAVVGGEWVALDPTLNQAQVLDASHVRFAVGRDQSDLVEEVTSGVSVFKQAPLVQVVEMQGFARDFSLKASGPSSVGPGALVELTASVSNNALDWRAVPLVLKMPLQPSGLIVSVLGHENKLVYLKPGELRKTVWTVVFPKVFKQGVTYEFPFSVSSLGESVFFSVNGSIEGEKMFERLTITSTGFEEHGAFVLFKIRLKNSGDIDFKSANASANLGGEQVETRFFSLLQGEERELVFRFGKPSIPGVYRGVIVIFAGRSELRQPIELSVEAPSVVLPNAPSGLEQYLIPALAVLALAAIVLVLLAKRGWKKRFERGLRETPVKYYEKK